MRNYEMGNIYFSKKVEDMCERDAYFAAHVTRSLMRYVQGDWGDIDARGESYNEHAVEYHDDVIVGRYPYHDEPYAAIVIFTEFDPNGTTIGFPEEYGFSL